MSSATRNWHGRCCYLMGCACLFLRHAADARMFDFFRPGKVRAMVDRMCFVGVSFLRWAVLCAAGLQSCLLHMQAAEAEEVRAECHPLCQRTR